MDDRLLFSGELACRHLAANGRLLAEFGFSNMVTTDGLTDALKAIFTAGTQRSWYMGLIDAVNSSEVASDDTMSSHPGWQELTDYQSAGRPAWSTLSAAGALLTNLSPVLFAFTKISTVTGIFLASNSTKGGASGVLWSTAPFAADRTFQVGEVLSVVYRVRAAGGVG